jgi:hypothetical protein
MGPYPVVAPPPSRPDLVLGVPTRRLGTILLALGLSGVLLAGIVGVGLVAGAVAARDLDARVAAAQVRISTTLGRVAAQLDLAATSFDHAGATIETTSQTVGDAANVLAEITTASNSLADALGITILGQQPFAAAARQLRTLSGHVTTFQQDAAALADRLSTNASDTGQIATQLRSIRDQVSDLSDQVGADDQVGQIVDLVVAASLLVGLLVLWIAVAAAITAWAGWRLRRSPG